MAWIDWEKVSTGVEKAGAGWSASIRRELELKKAEERGMRMFTFKLGEETKARKELMEEGNRLALDLERGKAALGSELQAYLGSPQLQSYMMELSGRPETQPQALATRDLIGRLQRFERTTPEDTKLLQTLPVEVQSPIAMGMGAVNKYYQKEDRETAQFRQQGEHLDAQTAHMEALTSALNRKLAGQWTPEEAMKLLDSSTKALATLQKDEYFRLLSKLVADRGVEGLKKEQAVQWQDYMKRYAYLQGAIKAASEVVYGKPTARPTPTPTTEEIVGQDFLTMLEESKMAETARIGLGEAGKFIYELLVKGVTTVRDTEIIKSFKKTFIEPFK